MYFYDDDVVRLEIIKVAYSPDVFISFIHMMCMVSILVYQLRFHSFASS